MLADGQILELALALHFQPSILPGRWPCSQIP